jgi:hypothetical protein
MRESLVRTSCACGQALWQEQRWNGFYLYPVFFPDGQRPQPGAELKDCPTCGRRLQQPLPHAAFRSLGALA